MLTLVLGGAASGKSAYAESLVLKTGLPRYYLATMQVWDAECAARVEKHRKMRAAKQFETVECPLHLEKLRLPARGTALLEDLGNLAANELYDKTIGAAKAWKVKADELFDRDKFIAKHVKDENMYNFEKSDDEREFQEFEKTEA